MAYNKLPIDLYVFIIKQNI